MPRVAIVASHPVQYQAPWFRALAQRLDLEVFFCHRQDGNGQAAAGFGQAFDWDVPLLDGYPFHWLTNISQRPGVDAFGGCDTPELALRLREGRFDACLVNGWYLKSYVQAIRACWRGGVPVLVRGDSQLATRRSSLKSAVKYLPYRWFLNRVDAHLYVGAANRAYLQSYGVPDEKLFFAPHFVDNDFFRLGADAATRSGAAARFREAAGVPASAIVFLFVGKFIARKRPFDFIEAIARCPAGAGISALMVGSGPLEDELEHYAERLSAPVTFLGFRNQSELPVCYAAADALVLPSDGRETWGLVVNEAMACGRPAIVSHTVGCARDLISPSTGVVFPEGDVAGLAAAMQQIAARLRFAGAEMANAASATVERYTPASATNGLLAALAQLGSRAEAMPVEVQ